LATGIWPSGASALLLNQSSWSAYQSRLRVSTPHAKPYSGDMFKSLSPISFLSEDELFKKLNELKSKKTKQNHDTSPANRPFSLLKKEDHGFARAQFEQCR